MEEELGLFMGNDGLFRKDRAEEDTGGEALGNPCREPCFDLAFIAFIFARISGGSPGGNARGKTCSSIVFNWRFERRTDVFLVKGERLLKAFELKLLTLFLL